MSSLSISNRIKLKRLTLNLTLSDVAKAIGLSEATVQRYESGHIKTIKHQTIENLAELFHCSPAYLAGWEDEEGNRELPLLGEIACGVPIFAEQYREQIPDLYQGADFALKCKGDSMVNARIFDGDTVYIRSQSQVENGEIAAVLIDSEATLKRVYRHENRLELRAENPLYPALNFEGDDLNKVKILGKAVAFISKIR